MDADYGITEPRNELDEFDSGIDTWWCDFCQDDIPMYIADGEPLPTRCPVCGHSFMTQGDWS